MAFHFKKAFPEASSNNFYLHFVGQDCIAWSGPSSAETAGRCSFKLGTFIHPMKLAWLLIIRENPY